MYQGWVGQRGKRSTVFSVEIYIISPPLFMLSLFFFFFFFFFSCCAYTERWFGDAAPPTIASMLRLALATEILRHKSKIHESDTLMMHLFVFVVPSS